MNDYRSSVPRLALGLASLALTAATLGLFVYMPAIIGSANGPDTQMANATPPGVEVPVVVLDRIEVRGMREAVVASATRTPIDSNRGTEPVATGSENIYRVSATGSKSFASEKPNPSSAKRARGTP